MFGILEYPNLEKKNPYEVTEYSDVDHTEVII